LLNLRHVDAFVAVVEEGGFHEASRRLGIAQPTVSQQIRKLEEELGAVLVERSRARCVPTAKGALFLPHARLLLSIARRAQDRLSGRRVTIGASSNIGIYLLQPHLRRLRDRWPEIEVELRIGPNPEMAEKLETGEVDLAFMEWWDGRPGFESLPWRRERLLVVVAPDHPWAGREEISAEELSLHPLLGGERGTGTGMLLRRALGDAALALRSEGGLGSTEAVKRAVRAGLGVSIVFESAVADEIGSGSLRGLRIAGIDLAKELVVVLPQGLPAGSIPCEVARRIPAA
jgi:DNA-binding transcriptional LysR family regulator